MLWKEREELLRDGLPECSSWRRQKIKNTNEYIMTLLHNKRMIGQHHWPATWEWKLWWERRKGAPLRCPLTSEEVTKEVSFRKQALDRGLFLAHRVSMGNNTHANKRDLEPGLERHNTSTADTHAVLRASKTDTAYTLFDVWDKYGWCRLKAVQLSSGSGQR